MSQNRRRNNDIVISIYTQAYNFTTSLRNKEINIKISEKVESVHTYEYKYKLLPWRHNKFFAFEELVRKVCLL